MLNDVFGLNLEVASKDSANMFHDSVDAVFNCKDLPMGFNVFDFQGGFANNDIVFIEKLLNSMPNTYLLV